MRLDTNQALGAAIRHHRIQRSWSQRHLGELVNSSQTRISKIERGCVRIDVATRETFEEVYSLEFGGLLVEIGRGSDEQPGDRHMIDRITALESSIASLRNMVTHLINDGCASGRRSQSPAPERPATGEASRMPATRSSTHRIERVRSDMAH